MNILIFNWRDIKHSWAGGSEIFIFELAKRWVKYGYGVTIFCAEDKENKANALPAFEIIDGISIYRKGGSYSVYLWGIIYYLFKLRYVADVLVDVENGIPFFTPVFSRKPKVCFVYHVHGKQFFYELSFPLNYIGYLIERYLFPVVYSRLRILSISHTTKQELIKLKFTGENISIVNPGLEHTNSNSVKKFSRPTILYLGRIKKYKRIDLLIKSLPKILEKVPDARLLLAGWGSEAPYISDLVMRTPLRRQIEIRGPVTKSQKKKLLSRSWVFVNPSIHEGWGISVIEANSLGTPAVAFDVPGLSDSMQNNKTGFLCRDEDEFIDKICLLLTNKTLRERLGNNAKEWSRRFDWEKSAKESLKILERA